MAVFLINDFSGGLSTKFYKSRIANNESPALRNCRFSLVGALSKRNGSSRNAVTGAGALRTLFSYRLPAMSSEQILIADSDDLLRATSLGTYTSVFTGMTTTYPPEILAFNNKVYISNGVDTMRSIDDANSTGTVAAAPISRFMVVHNNYLFHANLPATVTSRLQWSDRILPETYTSTNFEDIYPSDGAVINGMASFAGELIIFKGPQFNNNGYGQSSMFRVIGDIFDATNPTYSIERIPLPPNVGLWGHRSIRVYRGNLIFATNDGFYAYAGGGSEPEKISEIIRGDVNNWQPNNVQGGVTLPCATVWKDRYYCGIYSSTFGGTVINNSIYVLDNGKWWLDVPSDTTDTFSAGSGGPVDFTVFGGNLYYGSSLTNVLRQYDTGTSDNIDVGGTSAGVNMSYATKEFDFLQEQNFNHCFIHLRRQSSGTLTFEYQIDGKAAVSSSLDMSAVDSGSTESSASNLLRKQVLIGTAGRTIQFRFHNLASTAIEVYGIELYHFPKNSPTSGVA